MLDRPGVAALGELNAVEIGAHSVTDARLDHFEYPGNKPRRLLRHRRAQLRAGTPAQPTGGRGSAPPTTTAASSAE